VTDPARTGRVEVMDQVGDPARLERLTGWRARIGLDESLRDMAAGI
jgi:nucleoside-diphosphate-sugar epimerase